MKHTQKAFIISFLSITFAFVSLLSKAQIQDKIREKVEEANPAKPKEEKKDAPEGAKKDLAPKDTAKGNANTNGRANFTANGTEIDPASLNQPNTMVGNASTGKDKDKDIKIEDGGGRVIDTTKYQARSAIKTRDQTQYKDGIAGNPITYRNTDTHKYTLAKDKYIFGWHPHWVGEAYKSYNFSLLNVIAYYSYEVDPATGDYKNLHDWNETDLVRYAHSSNKNCKVLLSISNAGEKQNDMFLKNLDAQSTLVNRVVKLIASKKADGVHIDFEGIPAKQRDAFTNFVIDLAAKLRTEVKGAFVSISLPAVDFEQAFDVRQLNKHVNLLVITGAEFYGANSDIAGPVSQIKGGGTWWNYNLERSVDEYLAAGAEPKKLLLGLSYYGAEWVTNDLKTPSKVRKFVKYLTYRDIKQKIGFATPSEDAESLSSYYVYRDNNNNYRQIWYDDSLSLAKKYDWVLEKKLGGVGIWALGYDNGYPQLWQALGAKFGGGMKAKVRKPMVTPGFLGRFINPIVRLITNPQVALQGKNTFMVVFALLFTAAGGAFYAIYRYSCYFSQIFNLILRGSLTTFLIMLTFVIALAYNIAESRILILFVVGILLGAIIFLLLVRSFITEKQMP